MRPHIIGIAGPSSSGKTELARHLVQELPGTAIVSLDSYYRGRLELTNTPADAMRFLASGKTDFAVVAIVPGMYLIRELKLTNVAPVVRNVASHRYCYAVDKGNGASC